MSRLSILGASGHGKVVADAAAASGEWSEIVFFDDKWPEITECSVWKVIGNTNNLLESLIEYNHVVIAIGDNHSRIEKLKILKQNGAQFPNIIHPDASVSPHTKICEGTVVFAGAVVNIDAVIGQACIINTAATVDHDCVLDDAVHVSPGANLAGGATIGEASWIGIGASVTQQISIGRDVIVGAGAAVISNVDDNSTVAGVPAKKLES